MFENSYQLNLLVENGEIFASVAPESHAQAEVKSDKEALFNEYSVAYEWLRKKISNP